MFDAEVKVELPPHGGETETALNSGFHAVDQRISKHWISVVSRIQDFLKLYSAFQSPGFRISHAIFFSRFQIPRTEKFPDSHIFSWGDRILIKKEEG